MTKPPKPEKPPNDSNPDEPRPAAVRVTAAKCVRCGQPVQARYRPFCSQRCADIDLGQWATGTYRVPTSETGGSEDDGEG